MRLFVSLLLSLVLSGVAAAASSEPGPSRKEVGALIELVLPEEAYQASMGQMIDQMLLTFKQNGLALPADAPEKMRKVMAEVVPYAELKEWTIDLYVPRFTATEIRELTAFYKTPTGRKLARVLPELMGEVGKKTGITAQTRLPAAMKKYGLLPAK